MNSEEEQNKIVDTYIIDTYINEINIWKKLYYDEMEAQKSKALKMRQIIKSLEETIIQEKDEKAQIMQNFTNRINGYESRLVLYEKATKADYDKINNLKEENINLMNEINTLYSVSNNTP